MPTQLAVRPAAAGRQAPPVRPGVRAGLSLAAGLGLVAVVVHTLVPGVPTTLVAVLLGAVVAVSGALEGRRGALVAPGLHIASRRVLRIGVALLGLQVALTEVLALGWPVLAVVLLVVAGGSPGRWPWGVSSGCAGSWSSSWRPGSRSAGRLRSRPSPAYAAAGTPTRPRRSPSWCCAAAS